MSSIDNRLVNYWKNVQHYHRTGDDLWLMMLDSQTESECPAERRAADRFLEKVSYDRHTG